MTSWYAVGIGLVVLIVGNVLGLLIPGLGSLLATLLGGGAAGYVAGGGVKRGFWHGFLTGTVPGVVVSVVFVLGVLLLDFVFSPLGMLADAAGLPGTGKVFAIGTAGLFLAFVVGAFAVVSGLGGLVGSALNEL